MKSKGFTLIELMIVVAIIGILAAIAIPNYLMFKCKDDMKGFGLTKESATAICKHDIDMANDIINHKISIDYALSKISPQSAPEKAKTTIVEQNADNSYKEEVQELKKQIKALNKQINKEYVKDDDDGENWRK